MRRWMAGAVVAVMASSCSASDVTETAAADEAATPALQVAPEDVGGVDRMLTVDQLAAVTGVERWSTPEVQEGDGGPLPPVCGERTWPQTPPHWWDYSVVPLEDRQAYTEFVGVAVAEFPTATDAGDQVAAAAAAFQACGEFSYRSLAWSPVDLIEVGADDGGFVHVARADRSDEFLAGAQDRRLEVPALGCETWTVHDRFVAAVGLFLSEERLTQAACLDVARIVAAQVSGAGHG